MYLHTILSGILYIIKTTPHIMRKVLYIILNLHIKQSCRSILLSGFRGVALTNSFILAKFQSSKRAVLREKKIESKFPVDMRIYTLCPS